MQGHFEGPVREKSRHNLWRTIQLLTSPKHHHLFGHRINQNITTWGCWHALLSFYLPPILNILSHFESPIEVDKDKYPFNSFEPKAVMQPLWTKYTTQPMVTSPRSACPSHNWLLCPKRKRVSESIRAHHNIISMRKKINRNELQTTANFSLAMTICDLNPTLNSVDHPRKLHVLPCPLFSHAVCSVLRFYLVQRSFLPIPSRSQWARTLWYHLRK